MPSELRRRRSPRNPAVVPRYGAHSKVVEALPETVLFQANWRGFRVPPSWACGGHVLLQRFFVRQTPRSGDVEHWSGHVEPKRDGLGPRNGLTDPTTDHLWDWNKAHLA